MRVTVEGSRHSSLSIGETRAAIRFLGETLLGPRLSQNVSVHVRYLGHVLSDVDDFGETTMAYATWLDDNLSPREFEIEVFGRRRVRKTCEILSHEMVHVKQYARGELRDLIRGHRWKKRLIKNYSSMPKETIPWEREAYRLEGELTPLVLEHRRF